MYSFSSASQMCDPFPRRMNGGSPPTEPNARTGEFTPPGIMLSARCCKRRDCSTLRDVVDGIKSSGEGEGCQQMGLRVRDYYSSALRERINQKFIICPSFCNMAALS